jgi:predicted enzyme related to lactoylglutathione lyase
MGNEFCHLELNTGDVAKAKKFYGKLFTWRLQDIKMGPGMKYTMLKAGKGPGGGMQKKPMPKAPNAWLVYVQVGSVNKTLEQAKKLGGRIIVPEMPIPGMGTMGILQDPTGAHFGIWAPERKKPARRARKASRKR